MKPVLFMDHHSTTPVDPRVLESMLPFFTENFGNPASRQHAYGWRADEAVESSRLRIAEAISAEGKEIIFTSGATESNNLAVKGVAELYSQKGNHIITVSTEHKSVLDSCKNLEKRGFQSTYLRVDGDGLISLEALARAITPRTILVSVMAANNEIGTIQDIASIGKLCRERGVLFHTDAAQAVGHMRIDVRSMGIDLMSVSGHKIYGPKGVGMLYVRSREPKVRLKIQMDGGGHERGFRSGTLNVPSIVGLARALEISTGSLPGEADRMTALRERMKRAFIENLDDVSFNGDPVRRLPNNLSVNFHGVENSALMMSMKDVAVSTGSACTTGDPEPSHVMKAIGAPAERLHSVIRFGLGRFTTEAEVDQVVRRVIEEVNKLRGLSSSFHNKKEKTFTQ